MTTRECITRIVRPVVLVLLGGLCLPVPVVAETEVPPPDSTASSVAAPGLEGAPSASYLLKRMDELYESSGTTGRVEVVVVTPKKTRTMRMRYWGKGDDRALMVIEAPPRDAGTATLRVGDNLWNYLPKISRTIRVPPSMMMGSWMGSDLTNDDIVRESSLEDDYDSTLVGRCEDPPGWRVRLDAKPDVVGLWSRIDVVFDFETGLPVMSQSFDRKGRLSRSMFFTEVREMGGRTVPTVMTIVPEREEGRRTEFRYLDVEFDVTLSDDMFSLARLERSH
jgi:outer membrane lipoprotein-sorting protein